LFCEIGMAEIAGDEPLPVAELARYRQDGRAWVAAVDADVSAAYLIAGVVDGSLHIEQVSVHPRAAGRKIGRMLLDHAAAYAAAQGIRALTPRPAHPRPGGQLNRIWPPSRARGATQTSGRPALSPGSSWPTPKGTGPAWCGRRKRSSDWLTSRNVHRVCGM
jgi:GNAT superfamily N-acetyltransferase